MLATPANMAKAHDAPGGVFSACPAGCEGAYSATPGDYWNWPPDRALKCPCGESLRLYRRRVSIEEVDV